MRGRDFLNAARVLVPPGDESRRRAAIIHAYYALILECRDALRRWGRAPPPRDSIHASVRLALAYATDDELKDIARVLDRLVRDRNKASYDLAPDPMFESDEHALRAIEISTQTISLLDSIDQDAARRSAAIASLPN